MPVTRSFSASSPAGAVLTGADHGYGPPWEILTDAEAPRR